MFAQYVVPSQDACDHSWCGSSHKDNFTEYILIWMNTKNFAKSHVSLSISMRMVCRREVHFDERFDA